jgi:hypothetical protein
MPNKTDIANSALNMVGQQVIITALTDASVSARLCQLNIDMAIREVLMKAKWRAARGRAVLTQQTTGPAFGFTYAYLLPPDFLHIATFNDLDTGSVYPLPYGIEGKLLVTDEASVSIVYVKDLTYGSNDINVVDAALNNLFVLQLAIKLTWPLQQEQSLRMNLLQQLREELREAKRLDSANDRPTLIDAAGDSAWLPARQNSTQN